ncbi:10670_t:CDS:2 [Acaulospora colombiana]|uniref:10670_t:CDS:1 n=1 Tax=Acaulospora colombiana TaxID=27376 RepID=A0ACA9LZJ7_9GLOM|nr:10670_t:CDS:2 [Acaulospora colombiana]
MACEGSRNRKRVAETDEPLAILTLVTFLHEQHLRLEAYLKMSLIVSKPSAEGFAFESFGTYPPHPRLFQSMFLVVPFHDHRHIRMTPAQEDLLSACLCSCFYCFSPSTELILSSSIALSRLGSAGESVAEYAKVHDLTSVEDSPKVDNGLGDTGEKGRGGCILVEELEEDPSVGRLGSCDEGVAEDGESIVVGEGVGSVEAGTGDMIEKKSVTVDEKIERCRGHTVKRGITSLRVGGLSAVNGLDMEKYFAMLLWVQQGRSNLCSVTNSLASLAISSETSIVVSIDQARRVEVRALGSRPVLGLLPSTAIKWYNPPELEQD